MDAIVLQIQMFVSLQIGLWDGLTRQFEGQLDPFLLSLPSRGVVEFDNEEWIFMKHGLGVLFEEDKGQRKIDFHRIANGSSSFDAWSLSTYFGSLGQVGRNALLAASGSSEATEENLKNILAKLVTNGVVSERGEVYTLI